MTAGSEIEPVPSPSPHLSGTHNWIWQFLAELLAVGALLLALVCSIEICLVLIAGSSSAHHDFISYWASGQLFVHHEDPYDANAIQRLEVAHGFNPDHQVLIVRNPPSALVLVAPLGFVSYRATVMLWSLPLAACWILCLRMLWILHGRPKRTFRVFGYPFAPWFVLLLYAPALICVLVGQTGLFALLGLVLFLRFHRSQPFLAGVSLWLCALKPHLFLPFAVVLLLWVIVSRSYSVLAGAAIALGASSVVAALVNPSAWSQYARMMHDRH